MRFIKRRREHFPVCAKCNVEINPEKWDDCEKYFDVGGEIHCKDCFKEWAHEWVETNLEDVAAAADVPVIEV